MDRPRGVAAGPVAEEKVEVVVGRGVTRTNNSSKARVVEIAAAVVIVTTTTTTIQWQQRWRQ